MRALSAIWRRLEELSIYVMNQSKIYNTSQCDGIETESRGDFIAGVNV
jgi:hypothetical protein